MMLRTALILITLFTSYIAAEVKEISSMKEFRQVLTEKKPLCIMFYAPWCSACKSMKEPFNQAAQSLKKEVLFVNVDADNEKFKEIADTFGVEAIPTIIVKHVGVLNKNQLIGALKGCVEPIKENPKKEEKKSQAKKPAKKVVAPPKKTKAPPKKSAKKA